MLGAWREPNKEAWCVLSPPMAQGAYRDRRRNAGHSGARSHHELNWRCACSPRSAGSNPAGRKNQQCRWRWCVRHQEAPCRDHCAGCSCSHSGPPQPGRNQNALLQAARPARRRTLLRSSDNRTQSPSCNPQSIRSNRHPRNHSYRIITIRKELFLLVRSYATKPIPIVPL